jgi:hypothetical protein
MPSRHLLDGWQHFYCTLVVHCVLAWLLPQGSERFFFRESVQAGLLLPDLYGRR